MKFPKVIRPNPSRIIPWHDASPRDHFYFPFKAKRFGMVPPIPVVRAPEDLRHLGEYVNYNGHKRRVSAIAAEVRPMAYLIEEDDHILFLAMMSDIYEEVLEDMGYKFKDHYEAVCDWARKHVRLWRYRPGMERVKIS